MQRNQQTERPSQQRVLDAGLDEIAPEARAILEESDIARDPVAAAIARKLAEEAGTWRAVSRGEADLAPEDDPTGHA